MKKAFTAGKNPVNQVQKASAGPKGFATTDLQGENEMGLPDPLKAGVEALSGLSMNNVRVHTNSSKPAQLQALAYTQGTDIHLGPGQERHLPHEAWHVAQQAQGRVKPTIQAADGISINDHVELEQEADRMGQTARRISNFGQSAFKDSRFSPKEAVTASPIQTIQKQPNSPPGGAVIQCLMKGKTFLGKYTGTDPANKRDLIGNLLTAYESAWGYGYGTTYFSEYDGKVRRQQRLQILADLERNILEHFRGSNTVRINDAPESALMLQLLDDVQAEHEKQIGELLSYSDELPVDERNLSKSEKAQVQKNWQSIVGGAGNLKITEKQTDYASSLERTHSGFRVKALSSIARLLQGTTGRRLIEEANQGGEEQEQHITIAPFSNKNYDGVGKGLQGKAEKKTILPGIWDSQSHGKNSIKEPSSLQIGIPFWSLDDDDDPIGTYELAAKHYQTKGEPKGVVFGKRWYRFNEGGGSTVGYIAEHKDSENRIMTKSGREGLSPTSVALGHELGHAIRNRRGANIPGGESLRKLVGISPDERELWTSDEELVNITAVENKLLREKGLEERVFHKDYEDTHTFLAQTRFLKYRDSIGFDEEKGEAILTAIHQKDFDLADRLLQQENF